MRCFQVCILIVTLVSLIDQLCFSSTDVNSVLTTTAAAHEDAHAGNVTDTNFFVDFTAFIPEATLRRAPQFTALMKEYIAQHSILANRMDPNFCSRKFIVGIYACPQAVGNHMFEFLNGFMAAVVSNRTILWHFCNRRYCNWDDEEDCERVIHRFRWMLSYNTAQKIWKKRGCQSELQQSAEEFFEFYDHRLHANAEEITACCPFESQQSPFLNVGINCFMEMYALINPRAILSPAAQKRADIIRKHKAQFAYGFLFRTAFTIQESIKAENDAIIARSLRHKGKPHRSSSVLTADTLGDGSGGKCNEPLLVALHIRHSDANDNDRNHGEVACLQETISRVERHYGCPVDGILFASDRKQQMYHWQRTTSFPQQIIITSNNTHRHEVVGYTAEHGVHAGVGAVVDLDLLSRAHAFVGSRYFTHLVWLNRHSSTFSMLMACLQATNGVAVGELPSLFLPTCEAMDHNDAAVTPLYDENSRFNCSAAYLKDNNILLPPTCTNYVPL